MKLKFVYSIAIILLIFIFIKKNNNLENRNIKKSPNNILFDMRAYPTGKINTNAYKNAVSWKKSKSKNSNSINIWEFTGPTNIGGRITDIEIPTDEEDTYYIGAASGGIFKTEDAGASWTPIFDDQSMLAIGDIEISKTNTSLIYVGTGEVNAGGGSLAYDGDGIYKSEDAGLTWQNKGLEEVGSISKVLIKPQTESTIFVGAMGPLFRKDINRGVYRSTDNGDNWTKVLFVSDSTGIIDMAINPVNPNVLYAASWERIRRPNNRQYGGETSRIYRSEDGGDNWSELTNGLPTNPTQKGRISIDISQSNPDILYAFYSNQTGSIQGVYKTIDGGDFWTTQSISGLTGVSFHWWFGGIFVDPNDSQIIYNAGFNVGKSINGGNSWSTISPSTHVDQHAMAFNTQNPNTVLLGNDGGLYRSTNNGNSFSKINNLPITQFYRYTVDEQNENKRYGGAQDNNTIRTQTGAINNWEAIYGGDGFQPLIDPTNTNTIYALYQRGNLARSFNNGSNFTPILNGINPTDRNNWDSPITFDPDNSNTLYFGTDRVYKTTNQGSNWQSISPDLSNGPYTGNLGLGTITTIDVSPINNAIIYAGTDDGNVWVTENGGANWSKISDSLPNLWTTKVKASPFDENTIFVTFSGYRYGEDDGHVYVSLDKGVTWTNLSTNLPDVPVSDIEIDAFENLFIATDIGVLSSNDVGNSWQPFGENFPSVVVTDLYFHQTSQYLYAATYGRASYRIDLNSDALSYDSFNLDAVVSIYPNPVEDNLNIDTKEFIKQISILDINGKLMLQKEFFNNEINRNIDIAFLSKGVYFIKLKFDNRKLVKKFIKK